MHMIYHNFSAQVADKQTFLSDLWDHISLNRKKTKLVSNKPVTEMQEAVGN